MLDEKKRIDALIWQEFSSSIRVLLDNQYVLQSFWDHRSGKIDESAWKTRFASGKRAAHLALASGNTSALIGVLFNRLHTLRNQLIHGGATWNGSDNREQMRDCTSLQGKLVPLIIELMMNSADTLWGMLVIRWLRGRDCIRRICRRRISTVVSAAFQLACCRSADPVVCQYENHALLSNRRA